MNRDKRLVKNTFLLAIGSFLPRFASFVNLPILTACLSKEQYGTYDLISILVSLVLPITTLQIHMAVFRFLIEHKDDRNLASVLFSNLVAFVMPVAVVTLSVLYFFLPIEDLWIRFWVCLFLFFDTWITEIRQLMRGMSRNLDYSISAIISAVVKTALTVLLVYLLKLELLGAVIALSMSPVLSMLYLIMRARVYELVDFSLVSKDVLKEMLNYSWPMVPDVISAWVIRASDRFVVTMFLGLSANAVYAVAHKLPSLLSLAQSTFTMAWQENASVVSKDADAGEYYSRMFAVMLYFYAGCLGLIIACTPILFRILIRGDYSESFPQMSLLFLSTFFGSMATFLGGIYIAQKATKSVGITTVMAALCNLVVDLALIRYIGLYAASGSTLVSYLFLFLYRMIGVKKLVDIRYDYGRIFIAVSVIILESVLCFLNRPVIHVLNACFGFLACYLMNKQIVSAAIRAVGRRIGKMRRKDGQ